eukprot:scaffold17499_cov112-Isochrysis_galbana.AAC.4
MSARFRLTVGRWSVIQSILAGSPVHMVTRAMVCTVGGAHAVSRAAVAPTARCCMLRVCVALVLVWLLASVVRRYLSVLLRAGVRGCSPGLRVARASASLCCVASSCAGAPRARRCSTA